MAIPEADGPPGEYNARFVVFATGTTEALTLYLAAEEGHEMVKVADQPSRQVMDVVGVYEIWTQQTRSVIARIHELARVPIEIARD